MNKNNRKLIEINGNGLQFMTIYIGIGGFELGSGLTRSPGLVLICNINILVFCRKYIISFIPFKVTLQSY